MKVDEYLIAKIFVIVVDGCNIIIHVRFYFNETVSNSDHLIQRILLWIFAS